MDLNMPQTLRWCQAPHSSPHHRAVWRCQPLAERKRGGQDKELNNWNKTDATSQIAARLHDNSTTDFGEQKRTQWLSWVWLWMLASKERWGGKIYCISLLLKCSSTGWELAIKDLKDLILLLSQYRPEHIKASFIVSRGMRLSSSILSHACWVDHTKDVRYFSLVLNLKDWNHFVLWIYQIVCILPKSPQQILLLQALGKADLRLVWREGTASTMRWTTILGLLLYYIPQRPSETSAILSRKFFVIKVS